MKRRILSVFLCLIMLFGLFAMPVQAAGGCTCEGQNYDENGDQIHDAVCPLYVKPACTCENPEVSPNGTIKHTPGCPEYVPPVSTDCTCGDRLDSSGRHLPGCPLYSTEQRRDEVKFNVAAEREKLFAMTTAEEIKAYLNSLTKEQYDALTAGFSETDWNRVLYVLSPESFVPVITSSYTGPVGKPMPPVKTGGFRAPSFRPAVPAGKEAEDALVTSKVVNANTDGSFTITLESYTTGTVSAGQKVPTDIVLVLDESGSMDDKISNGKPVYDVNHEGTYFIKKTDLFGREYYVQVKWCNDCNAYMSGIGFERPIIGGHGHAGYAYTPKTSPDDANGEQFYSAGGTKRETLQEAAKLFVQNVYDDAVANDVNHRIGVVGFSPKDNASIKVGLTESIITTKGTVDTAIDNLNANGSTYVDDGIRKAKQVFDNASNISPTTRQRVVVVFTDGAPGKNGWGGNDGVSTANSAISEARSLKQGVAVGGYGATVYSVAVLEGANPNAPIDNGSGDDARTNRFLHYLSSNYPNATSLDDGGTGSNQGYYLAASSADGLKEIFENISEGISTPSIELDGTTVLKDTITEYFQMPANTDDIKVYTAKKTATDWAERVATNLTPDVAGNTVTVTGFNYNDNFVTDKPKTGTTDDYGKKLIVEFTVTPKPDFLGGNNVPTNTSDSGIILGQDTIENFPVPHANVPIQAVTVTGQDKNVYLTGSVTEAQLREGATVTVGGTEVDGELTGGVTLDLSKADFGLANWQKEHVDILVSIVPETFTNLMEDTTYTISVTVQPKSTETAKDADGNLIGDAATAQVGTANPRINVFKPTLTFHDGAVFYGDTVPKNPEVGDPEGTKTFNDYLEESITWTHQNADGTFINSTVVEMIGGPEAKINELIQVTQYQPEGTDNIKDGKINTKDDFHVEVNEVKLGDFVIFDDADKKFVNFNHTGCDPNCGFDKAKGEFMLHVNTCQLTINKSGGNSDEFYVFDVYKDGEKYTEISVKGNGSETIYELPVGEYSIRENQDWSWRFNTARNGGEVTLSRDSDEGELTCINKSGNPYWLNGYSQRVKNIYGVANSAD